MGDAVGISMLGVITFGVGEGEGLGLVELLVGVRRGRGAVLLFFGVAFGLGFAAGLGMTCPSCCGSTLMLSAQVKASTLTVRSAIFRLLGRLMVPP